MLVKTNVKFHSEVMLFPHFPDLASLLELLPSGWDKAVEVCY